MVFRESILLLCVLPCMRRGLLTTPRLTRGISRSIGDVGGKEEGTVQRQ